MPSGGRECAHGGGRSCDLQVYMIQEDYASAYTIAMYQQATRPMDPEIVRDAGLFLYYLGRIPGICDCGAGHEYEAFR